MPKYEIHPVADMLPGLTEHEAEALKQDIKENGQIVPILIYENRIIDGRHRYWACNQLGIEPQVKILPDGSLTNDKMVAIAVGSNIIRRHLTASQKAALAVNALPYFEEQARERMLATQNNNAAATAKLQEQDKGESASHVAALFAVSPRYVHYAKAVREWDEATFLSVLRGETTLSDAGKIMKKQMGQSEVESEDMIEKALKVPNPPLKWEADIKYEIHGGGEHLATFLFNSDTLQWNATYHETFGDSKTR